MSWDDDPEIKDAMSAEPFEENEFGQPVEKAFAELENEKKAHKAAANHPWRSQRTGPTKLERARDLMKPFSSFTGPQLADAIGLPRRSGASYVLWLQKKGWAEKVAYGLYRIVGSTAAPEAPENVEGGAKLSRKLGANCHPLRCEPFLPKWKTTIGSSGLSSGKSATSPWPS